MKNKKILLSVAALIIVGAVFFFQTRTSETPVSAETPSRVKTPEAPPVRENIAAPSTVPVAATSAVIEEELEKALEELPTLETLKDLDEHEVHHTPQVVKEGGVLIGTLLRKAEEDPARRAPTLEMFLKCAEDAELVPAVRALCWNKLLNQVNEWKLFVPVSEARVPTDIKDLAHRLR